MFCVFGRSRPLAKKKIHKLMSEYSLISRVLKKLGSLSQKDRQIIVSAFIDIEFKVMRPRKCTHEFSAPEFSKEAYDLMKVDSFNFDDITLMKKIPKEKGVTHSKKSGKELLGWVRV